jgi:hypothetical protein
MIQTVMVQIILENTRRVLTLAMPIVMMMGTLMERIHHL